LIPFYLVPFLAQSFYGDYSILIGAVLFIFLAITDSIDGYLARKYDVVSDFGKFWDPLADKLLVYSAFFLLVYLDRYPLWVVIVLLARETLITLHRSVALGHGKAIAAVVSGKVKTTIQMITIIVSFIVINNAYFTFVTLPSWVDSIDLYLLYITLAVTVYSGIDYFKKNKKAISPKQFGDGLIREYLSVFGAGKFPVAPGTFGSFIAVLLLYFWLHSAGLYNFIWVAVVTVTGAFCAKRSVEFFGKPDAKQIVLDEVVGQTIALAMLPLSWKAYLLGFILFRFFDIVKPYPVCAFDRMENGWGIMMDDVVAGVYAAIVGIIMCYYIPWFGA